MFIFIWLITIVISYFLLRQALKISKKVAEEKRRNYDFNLYNDTNALVIIGILLFPFINVISSIIILLIVLPNESLIEKIFKL